MPSLPDRLVPNDARVSRQYADVDGHRWSYLDTHARHAPQARSPRGTIVLIHGFPDISFGWRYQIPLFLSLGFRCVALDCMGYGETGTSTNLRDFGFKAHADAVAGIAKAIGVRKIIIGGHDWGGVTVYRVAQYHPALVSHIFSVCTAYMPPTSRYISVESLASTTLPQFGYQLQFGSEDGIVERAVRDETNLRKFLKGMYGGRPQSGKRFMDPKVGADLDLLEHDEIGRTPLLSDEEFDHYVSEFTRNPFSGPCNWYRTRKVNWEDEKSLPEQTRKVVTQPTLYILATRDDVLTREMSEGMERAVPNLTRGEVRAAHWALWQTPNEVNALLKEWIEGVVLGGKSKL